MYEVIGVTMGKIVQEYKRNKEYPDIKMQAFSHLSTPYSLIQCLDPRLKIVLAVLFSVWMVTQGRVLALVLGFGLALGTLRLARLSWEIVWARLRPLNLFTVLLWLILPLTNGTTGEIVIWQGLSIYSDGIAQALKITLTMNAIACVLMAFLSTMDIVTIGHALSGLKVPEKLVHLLLFTVRYLTVLHASYQQLTQAMRVRGFRLQATWHCYRSIGFLLGMLLVRSVARAKRIEMAMKCRGFRGQFYLLTRFQWQAKDSLYLIIWGLILFSITAMSLSI
ncbi:cobalt ABC transporter, permease protein CbiQ [Beggiatoa alba B18LD]|uniref:Cobalt ABC transporter, permease protein CbiQ n=1 Tax=Beggiatoa alba B18LD TaxID=395493 RepID=I3CIH1_9GAMM|nr:cobalt ECF transporter T component CbiQ [Beggiatoa alba]EIJ43414.1 cobalt ABC transporter, permease protein CbiQ [Beggiatoa alba B18LD]